MMTKELQRPGSKPSRAQELEDERQAELANRRKTIDFGGPSSPARYNEQEFRDELRFLLRYSLKGDGTISIPPEVKMTLGCSSRLSPEFTNDLTVTIAFKQLPPQQQHILIQHYVYGRTWTDLGKETFYSKGGIKYQVNSALNKIRFIICTD